jgi:hypothetical protein
MLIISIIILISFIGFNAGFILSLLSTYKLNYQTDIILKRSQTLDMQNGPVKGAFFKSVH